MAEKKILTAVNIIKNYFKLNKISLEKIILFGSYANENYDKNSDIDFIIISRDFKNKSLLEKAKLMGSLDWELIKNTDSAFDVLYYSSDDWKYSDSLILNEARKNGRLIFEK